MTAHTSIAHDSGRRRVVERQHPRRSKREAPEHVDRYAEQPKCEDEVMAGKLAALATYVNGGRR